MYFYNLGIIQQYLKNDSEAEAALVKAFEIDPNNPDYIIAIVDFFMKGGKNEMALKYVNEWLKLHPEDASGYELLEMIKGK